MLYIVIFFLFFVFIALLILQLKVKVTIEYQHDSRNDHMILSFSTLKGFLNLKYEIPLVEVEKKGFKITKYKKAVEEEIREETAKKPSGIGDIFEKIKYYRNFYAVHKSIICEIRDYLKTRFILSELDFDVEIGMGDAFYTGIFNGVVWAFIGILTSLLTNNFTTLKKHVDVKSNFMEKKLNADLFCIFNIKFVHIIMVRIKVLLYNTNLKAKLKRTIGGGLIG